MLIDGGNSWFEDTRRREAALRAAGIHFVGCGVSGGEEGARFGPSHDAGRIGARRGSAIKDVLEAIAARTEAGPCVTHVGPDGAGHFVKMVHNGIEYGDTGTSRCSCGSAARTSELVKASEPEPDSMSPLGADGADSACTCRTGVGAESTGVSWTGSLGDHCRERGTDGARLGLVGSRGQVR